MKNSLKRTFAFLLAVVMITASLPITAIAAGFADGQTVYAYRYPHLYTGSDGQVYKDVGDGYNYLKYIAANETQQEYHASNSTGHSTLGVGSSSGQQRAYCIEAGVDIFGSEPLYTASKESNAAYLKWLSTDQQKYIKLALMYGSHFEGDSKVPVSGCNDDDFAFATQVIIWEIQQQLRTAPKNTDTGSYTVGVLKNNSVGTDRLTFYDQIRGRPALECYKYILEKMAAHDTLPSFTAKLPKDYPTHTLKYNSATGDYRITLTDSNNTGATISFLKNTPGITVTKDGNKYTFISKSKITSATSCTARKDNVTNPDNLLVWANTNYNKDGQHLATGYSDPVTFGAKFVTEATGSITIDKSYSQAGGGSLSDTKIREYRNVLEFKIKNNSTGEYIKADGDRQSGYTYNETGKTEVFQFKANTTSGKINISEVPAGTYTVIETKGNTGYTCTGNKVVTVTAGNTSNAPVTNKQDTKPLIIEKEFTQADGSTLSTAKLKENRAQLKFKITNSSGQPIKVKNATVSGNDIIYTYNGVDTSATGGSVLSFAPNTSTGYIIVNGLPKKDTYTVTEITCNTGYTCKGAKTVNLDTNSESKATITNAEDTGIAQIKKVWKPATNSASLNADVYFVIKNSAGAYVKGTNQNAPSTLPETYKYNGTTTNGANATKFMVNTTLGTFLLKNLPVGTYTVYESTVAGTDADTYRKDAAYKTVTITKGKTGEVTFNNKNTISLTIHKTFEGEENMTPTERAAEYAKVSFSLYYLPPYVGAQGKNMIASGENGDYTWTGWHPTNKTVFTLNNDGYCDIDLSDIDFDELVTDIVVVEHYSGTKYTADTEKTVTRPTSTQEIIELPEIVFDNPKKKGTLNIDKVFNLPANARALTDAEKKAARNELRFVVQEKITHSEDNTVSYVYVTADGSNGSYTYTGTSGAPSEFCFAADSVSGAIEIANIPIGDYIVYETTGCTNFTCDGDANVTVTEGNTATATIYNTLDKGSLEVTKTFKDETGAAMTVSSDVISQIEFTLKDKNGKYITASGSDGSYTYTGTSSTEKTVFKLNSDAKFTIYGLPARQTYTVAETKGAEGFSFSSTGYTLTVEPNQTATTSFENEAMKGEIKIVKRSSDGILSGWNFRVHCTSSVFDDWGYDEVHPTDENGEIHIENLRVGEYTVEEVTTGVVGYITPDSKTVTVTNGNTTTVNEDNYAYGSIKILKVSTKDNTTPVSGATFGIYSDAACTTPAKAYKVVDGKVTDTLIDAVVYELSSSAGTYVADNLPVNSASGTKYYVKELTAPVGFVLNTNVFTVTKKSTTTAEIVTVSEAQYGGLEITKKDTASGEKLTGATFGIYTDAACTTAAKKYKVVSGVVTSTLENAVISETSTGVYTANYLPYGTYYIKETKAPANHALDSTVHTVTVGAISAETTKIDLNNTRYGSVEITKVDKDFPTNKVSGATYGIYTNAACTTPAKAFKVVGGVVTSTKVNATITEVGTTGVYKADYLPIETKPMKYYVKELTAAPNYKLDNEVYTLTVNGATGATKPNMTLTHNEKAQDGSLQIVKRSADGVLAGWNFNVICTSSPFTGYSFSQIITTNDEGKASISGLRIGTYKVIELAENARGYILPAQQTITITADTTTTATFTNIPYGSLEIKKVSTKDNTTPVSGAKFGIYTDAACTTPAKMYKVVDGAPTTTKVDAVISETSTGVYTANYLPIESKAGTKYYVKETKAPTGYFLNPTVFTVTETSANGVQKINVSDTPYGHIKVIKTDTASGSKLSGAEFNLYKDSNNNGKYDSADTLYKAIPETATKGEYVLTEIPYGTYFVKEVKAPANHALDSTATKVVIGATPNETVTVDVGNPPHGGVEVKKVDKDYPDNKLTGATFGVYTDAACTEASKAQTFEVSNNVVTNKLVNNNIAEVGTTGVYKLNNLPITAAAGTKYYLKEIKAPQYFVLDNTVYPFVLSEAGATVPVETAAGIGFANKPQTGSIKIVKHSADSKVGGWKFRVCGEAFTGQSFDEIFTTDEKGEILVSDLRVGEYTIEEVVTDVLGYITPEAQTAIVEYSKIIQKDFTNTPIGNVHITKVDKDYPESKLSGAEFTVYKSDKTTVVGTLTEISVGEYQLNDLPYGNYYVKETKAPANFVPDENYYPFSITEAGATVTVNTPARTSFVNDAMRGGIKVVKRSADGKLKDWAFRVECTSSPFDFYEYNEIFTTNENGEISVSGLRIGTYEITEQTTGKTGYIFADDKEITITFGHITEIDEKNIPIGNAHITKIDNEHTNVKLHGAEFTVYDEDKETVVGKLDELKDSNDELTGEYELDDIEYGDYFLKETKAPDNYVLDENYYPFSITEAGATVEIENALGIGFTNVSMSGNIKIVKRSADGVLEGWQFRVKLLDAPFEEYSFDKVFTTDENGEILITDIRIGTYEISEITDDVTGYFTAEAQTITVEYGVTAEVDMENIPYGTLEVRKVDRDDHTVLVSGSTYGVYLDVNENGTYEEDIDTFYGYMTEEQTGIYTLDKVPYGKYLVKELAAPVGYLVDENFFAAEIETADNTVDVSNVNGEDVFTEAPIEGSVYTVKIDEEYPDNKLTGAEFTVYAEDKETVIGVLEEIAIGEYRLDNIRYGNYFLKETKAPEYFIADDNLYPFSIREQDEIVVISNNEVGTTSFANSAQKGALKIAKSSSDGTVEGFEFEVTGTAYTGQEYAETFKTDANGEILIENLRVGDYTVRELDNDLTLSYILPADKMLLIENGEQSVVDMYNDEVTIKTTATVDGEKETYATGTVTLTDTVSYTNLTVGKEYTLKGLLMDKSTGERLLINGEPVTAETTFTAETKDGEVIVEFVFDASAIKTETETVVFEALYRDGKEIAVHTDIEDEGQTVIIKIPKIHTTATIEGGKEVYADRIVTLDDKVSYTNLTVGKEYTLKGVLMDKATEKPFTVNGKEITSELTFIPTEKDGEVTVTFTFDTSTVTEDTDVVVFESLYRDGIELITHTDINDKDQTVKIKTPPDTPDTGVKLNSNIAFVSAAAIICGTIITVLPLCKRKKNKKNG